MQRYFKHKNVKLAKSVQMPRIRKVFRMIISKLFHMTDLTCAQKFTETFLSFIKGPDMIMMRTIDVTKINKMRAMSVMCLLSLLHFKKKGFHV